jgi:hypothetical protein
MEMRFALPCAARAPPVMLWVISLRPGFMFNIFAGVVLLKRQQEKIEVGMKA